MIYEVILAQTAVETLDAIYDQIEIEFGINAARKFELKVIQTLESISIRPFIFKATQELPNVRKGWINKTALSFMK